MSPKSRVISIDVEDESAETGALRTPVFLVGALVVGAGTSLPELARGEAALLLTALAVYVVGWIAMLVAALSLAVLRRTAR